VRGILSDGEGYLMCRYANAFISGLSRGEIVIPEPPMGLVATFDDTVEDGVKELIGDTEGTYLLFHDGHCLCQYEEWGNLFGYVERLRSENNLSSVQVIVFWSGTEYEAKATLYVDPELDLMDERPEEGRVFKVGVSIPRRLELRVGMTTRMKMKSGLHLEGVLETYDSYGEYGTFRTHDGEMVYFSAAEIKYVDV
jgi:hypothetical protein